MTRALIVISSALLLTACAWLQDIRQTYTEDPTATGVHEKIQFAGEVATAEERSLCEAAGGEVRRDGLRGWEQCIQPYADAGKTCSDNAECLGQCRLTLDDNASGERQNVTGTCQVNDSPFGCYATVEDGKSTGAICVD